MGKKNIYTSSPTKPRLAKVAWTYATESFKGNEPDELTYNARAQRWTAKYKGAVITIYDDDLRGAF